ncbi:MAG: lgrB [Sphaerisporangium sp.]|jgi:condensation enzyme|nr:lgrB [Sphaerisporangium sp.]
MSISETTHAPSGLKDRIPLSFQQEFLCLFDKGDSVGPFGPRYHIVDGWRLHGELDLDVLRKALDDVVERHEALRTVVARGEGDRYQEVLPPSSPELSVRDLSGEPDSRELQVERLLIEIESGDFSVRERPLLRATLGRFDDRDAILVLIAHHTAVDAWSMQLILRDLAAFYAARKGHDVPELPPAVQYQEYAAWQREGPAEATSRSGAYWRERLAGARIVALPTDRLRSAEPVFSTGWYRFALPAELRSAITELAASMKSSAFMVMLAAFKVFVHRSTGATDVVVPTFAPGRGKARFEETVGSFFNFLPIRTDLAGCGTFREVVGRTRASCIGAYSRELPLSQILQEAPELMVPAMVDGLASCVFQVLQDPFTMDHELIGDLEYSAIRRRELSQPLGSDIPDGTLWTLKFDASGDIGGELGYSSNLIDESTVRALAAEYLHVLREVVGDPGAPLDQV